MRHALSIFFALLLCSLHAQVNNIYTSGGISQTVGAPTYRPGAKGNIVAIDTVTGTWYVSRDRNSVNWLSMGQRIEQISGCSAPAYTPNKYNSDIVMNACATPELYYHSGGGTWVCLNCAGATDLSFTGSDSPYKLNSSTGTDVLFRASTNVTLSRSGDTLDIAASGGISTVNTDATLSGDGSSGTPLKIAQQSATSGQVLKWNGTTWAPAADAGTTYTGGTGIDVTGTVISNTGDLSATNELNTAASVTGGSLRITDAGGNKDVPVTDIAPVQAVSAGTGISISGTSTRTITNNAPDQTVSITGEGVNVVTGTYPNFTVTGTEADGSTTNELQTLSIAGQNITLSAGGGTVAVPGTDLGLFDNGDNTLDITSSTGLPIRVAGGNLIGVYDDGGQLTIDFNGLILSGSGSNNYIPIWSGAYSLNSSAKFTYDEVANRGLIGTTTSSGRTLGVYADIFLEKAKTDLNSAIESERNAVSFLEGGSGESDNLMVLSRAGHVEGTAGSPIYTSKNSILAQNGLILGNSKIQFYYNGLVTSGTPFTPTSVMEYNGGTSTWSLENLSVTNSLAVTSPLQVTPVAEQRAVFTNSNDTRRNSFEILSGDTGESDNGLFFNRAFKTTGASSGTYTSTNSIIRAAGIRVLGQKIELIGSPSLVTSGSTFTPSVYNSTDIITGDMTMTGVSANTSTVEDRILVKTNSSGTAAAGFGGGIKFQLESSTTDNQDAAAVNAIWTTATHASRTSALLFSGVNNGGAIGEFARFEGSTAPTLKIASAVGTAGTTLYANGGITAGATFTVGNSSSGVTIGGGTGAVTISNSSTNNIAIHNTVNAAASTAGIVLGNAVAFAQTSGTRDYIKYNSGFAPTSGTAVHNQFTFSGTFNQTGGASGITRGLYLNQTLTAVADFRGIEIAANSSNAKGIYQTGASTKNTFVGATGFGATTAPTDKVEVTGNLALLTAGNKLKIATGSNASVGTTTLASGTVTVSTTAVTSSSLIFVVYDTPSGTLAAGLSAPVASITNGTSFVINSLTTAGTVNTADNSSVRYWIIN